MFGFIKWLFEELRGSKKAAKMNIPIVDIPTVKAQKVEVKRFEPKKFEPAGHDPMTFTFRNTMTGELHEVAYGDQRVFDKYMNNRYMQLVFK